MALSEVLNEFLFSALHPLDSTGHACRLRHEAELQAFVPTKCAMS